MAKFTIYKNIKSGLPKATEEHKILMSFRRQPTGITEPSKEIYVVAYMSEEFSYSCGANYKNILNITPIGGQPWDIIKDETQRSIATYGYATKKSFENNTSTNINIKFRIATHLDGILNKYGGAVVYGEEITNPAEIADVLAAMTMPIVGPKAIFNFTSITGDSLVSKAVKETVKTAKNVIMGAAGSMVNLIAEGSFKDKTESPTLPKASGSIEWPTSMDDFAPQHPYICELAIGKIFRKDYMVIKNFEVTFSKEYFQEGWPLFADYTVTLESLFNSANQMNSDKDHIFGSGFKRDKLFRVSVSNTSKDTTK